MRPRLLLAAFLALAAAPRAAQADLPEHLRPVVRIDPSIEAAADVSNIIFLNRCVGGCTIMGSNSISDARTNTSSIPQGGPGIYQLGEWAHGDTAWDALVACVRDVYAPYDVEVTDVDPGEAVIHHEAIVAGVGADIGWNAGGVGNVSGDCQPYDNGISFVFANQTPDVEYLCYAVAQETAHTYGLDHAYLCSDPMTYLGGCGRKYFRNLTTPCGEFSERPCRCGNVQNSHVRLNDVFGPSPVAQPVPTVSLADPTDGATVGAQFAAIATAQSTRGVSTVELWVNGYRWVTEVDDEFENQGGTYTLRPPAELPDGVLDLEVRAYNDLGTGYGSVTATVTKGAPCTSAAACAVGQQCEEGRCFWEPATGELGDACGFDQACISGRCEDDGAGGQACTQACITGTANACPSPFACVAPAGATAGLCLVAADDPGCCGAADDPGARTGRLLLTAGVLGLLVLRPRRRTRVRR
ncbi:MAG: hypothetical protein R2939_05315 [Kofleriaceae bacterium]